MICYKEKTNILFRVRISSNFTFYNQKDNFSTFYDNNSLNWLVKFESKDQDEFIKTLESYAVKIVNATDNSEITTKNEKPELPQKPLFDSINKDDSLSDSSGSKQRANILNRMAKMGQAILPKPNIKNTSTEQSDSDFEDKTHERRVPPRQKRAAAEKSSKQLIMTPSNVDNVKIISSTSTSDNNYQHNSIHDINNGQQFSSSNQIVPSQQVLFNPQQLPNQIYNPQIIPSQMFHSNFNDGYTQYIIAQNTELKMNLAQISSKLDTVLKTNKTNDEDTDKKMLLTKLKTMKLKTENLEAALQRSERSYDTLIMKYEELEKKLQNTCEVDEKNKELDILENTISELKLKLQESQNESKAILTELERWQIKSKEQEDIIQMQQEQLKDHSKLELDNKYIEELHETIKTLNSKIDILKLKQKDFEIYFEKSESEKKLSAQANNTKIKLLEDVVKRHMNEMYQSILDNFKDGESYNYSDIHKGVTKNLKLTSFKIIDNCISVFKESNVLEE